MLYVCDLKNYRAIMHRAYVRYTREEGYTREESLKFISELQNEKVKDVYDLIQEYLGVTPRF